jgi:hypothetical protein
MSGSITWLPGSVPFGMDPATTVRIKRGKSPTDKTVFDCDFSGALSAIDCDTIAQDCVPSVSILRNDGAPADCYCAGTPSINEDWTRVSVWIVGGSPGYEYLVSTTVISADGQIITRSFIVPCTIR